MTGPATSTLKASRTTIDELSPGVTMASRFSIEELASWFPIDELPPGLPEAWRFPIDDLPPELLIVILSHLSWRQQLVVRRVSRRWQEAADASLAGRRELHISSEDLQTGLNTERLLNLLQSMPTLRRLCVDRTGSYVDRRFLVGGLISVDQLCDSCSQLQAINLHCGMDDADVETLLHRLPGLLSLHLSDIKAKGTCLSLVPPGLQSFSLRAGKQITSTSIRHLTRCRLLRELDLSGTGALSENLAAVVTACPQLERLAVAWCQELTSHWVPELRHCPRLQELDISGLVRGDPNLSGVLTACDQLKRLRVARMCNPLSCFSLHQPEGTQPSTFPFTSLPGLTHLDLGDTKTDDDTFCRLPKLLPNLRDLRLKNCKMLTNSALANVLPHLTSLQVLDLHGIGYSDIVVSSFSGLSLKALAYDCLDGKQVVDLILRCSTLTVLRSVGVPYGFGGLTKLGPKYRQHHSRLPLAGVSHTFSSLRRRQRDLDRDSDSKGRKVTLVVDPGQVRVCMSVLPRYIRAVGDRAGLWGELVGW